ncbi:MAG: LPXTG cell wall anchor domain-containing protein, partial [Actinomycetota bacterium]|nr:LPXTG cell wall anchor domain-containing protein [Actinomycetota bacterium]
ALICLLPSASQADRVDLATLNAALHRTTQQLGNTLQQSLDRTAETLRKTQQALRGRPAAGENATPRATATDPQTQPPLHGTNPHGQGGVAVVDVNPSSERPLGGNPDGSDAGPEEIVIGRARGEKTAGGAFHGHITILALLGNEVAAVDTKQGETKNGPLQPLQDSVLDPLCTASAGQACLSVLTANSTTTSSGSTNDFAIARANVLGLGVGTAESSGVISENANCQTAAGGAKTANVTAPPGAIAQVANSSSTSRSCRNQAPQTVNSSMVIGLGGVAVPLPAAGCATGAPDTVTGLPPLLPVVCHADDVVGAAAVREALDVFLLSAGGGSLLKETTGAAESISVAPKGPENGGPECSDGADNDGDGVIDADDPGCHSDGNPNNPDSYNPNDDDERDGPRGGGGDDDGGPKGGGGGPNGGGSGRSACSDGVDNDGDGVIDARDPGCHTDGDPNNPDSYNPNDDDEADGGRTVAASTLPFTGADITGLALAGLLLLAGGLLLRRREGARGWL